MKLDDFNSTFNSAKVSKVLEDKFGTKVSLNKLNLKQLRTLKSRVTEAHKRTVKSMPFNSGHRNPEYLEQVALLEAIELRINEVDMADEGFLGGVAGSALGGMAGGPVGALAGGYLGSKLDDKVEEVKDEEGEEDAGKKPFSNLSGSQTSALRTLVGPENITAAKNALKYAKQGKSVPANMMKGFAPIVDLLLDVLQGGASYARRLQALDKQASGLRESRHLFEGETEKAQLIMAVKDMVDRVQGMVEDLNKMKVEDLVALTDKMRDEFGQDQATSFTSGANDILSAGIDALTNARSELDNAVLGLTGEAPAAAPAAGMPGAEMPAPGAEMPAPEAGAELPAEPGAELPPPEGGEEVGRELRESRARMRRRILESSRFLGKLAK